MSLGKVSNWQRDVNIFERRGSILNFSSGTFVVEYAQEELMVSR